MTALTTGTLGAKSLQRLIGEIISVPDGYAFVGRTETVDGRTYDTNGDVFLHPIDNPEVLLEVGRLVEFSLTNDPRRDGRYRAIGGVMVANLPVLAGDLINLPVLAARQPFHARAKEVDPADVRKAFANRPFNAVIGAEMDDVMDLETAQDVQRLVDEYLDEVFPGLRGQNVSFDLFLTERNEEGTRIAGRVTRLTALGMKGQSDLLHLEYDRFLVTIDSLRALSMAGILVPGSRLSRKSMGMLIGNPERLRLQRSINAGGLAAFEKMSSDFTGTVRFLKDNGLLRPASVIPIEHTVELFLAAPVWYVVSKEMLPADRWTSTDPLPDGAVQYFGSLFGTQEWANLYQMFNRRTRPLALYQGDQMPEHIMDALERTLTWFDYVVIATPYHDVAGREWEDPRWKALIDPYLVGFKKGVPYLFFLGRWSDTGMFPLIGDMIADTMAYLRTNKAKLAGFGYQPYWHFCQLNHPDNNACNNQPCFSGAGRKLPLFVDALLAHFDQGTLFDFLRGTLATTIVPAMRAP